MVTISATLSDAANGGVIKRLEVWNIAAGENGVSPRPARSMKSQPAAKAAMPYAVLYVFSFVKDGIKPRLLDGKSFHAAVVTAD